jgi:phosphomannomutase
MKDFAKWPVTRRENLDGIKIYLGDKGWLMVRASGTENLLRIYSEMSSKDAARQALDATRALVEKL